MLLAQRSREEINPESSIRCDHALSLLQCTFATDEFGVAIAIPTQLFFRLRAKGMSLACMRIESMHTTDFSNDLIRKASDAVRSL